MNCNVPLLLVLYLTGMWQLCTEKMVMSNAHSVMVCTQMDIILASTIIKKVMLLIKVYVIYRSHKSIIIKPGE